MFAGTVAGCWGRPAEHGCPDVPCGRQALLGIMPPSALVIAAEGVARVWACLRSGDLPSRGGMRPATRTEIRGGRLSGWPLRTARSGTARRQGRIRLSGHQHQLPQVPGHRVRGAKAGGHLPRVPRRGHLGVRRGQHRQYPVPARLGGRCARGEGAYVPRQGRKRGGPRAYTHMWSARRPGPDTGD